MVNKVQLLGHLGKDPEVRSTSSGQTVANFSLATTRKWKGNDGEKKEETEWHRCVVWGRQAEVAAQYLHKGKQIFVEGRIQTRKWEKDGEARYSTEVVVENFQMLGGPRDDKRQAELPADGTFDPTDEDSSIPF